MVNFTLLCHGSLRQASKIRQNFGTLAQIPGRDLTKHEGMQPCFFGEEQARQIRIAAMQMIDPDGSVHQDHLLLRDRRPGR